MVALPRSSRVRSSSLDLQRDRISPAYRQRLEVAGERFKRWCHQRRINLADASQNPPYMSSLLTDYLQQLFDEGAAYWWALHAVLYVQTEWRPLRGYLTRAWDSVSTWRLHMPVSSRIPLRYELVQALCFAAVLFGSTFEPVLASVWFGFAAVLRFSFFGLLRPKELYTLRIADILVPRRGTHSLLQCAVATIREPKNRAAGGRLQVRLVRDEIAVAWLAWVIAERPLTDLLWPFGTGGFQRALRKLLKFTGLHTLGITPGSIRAGGATALLEQGLSVANIMFAGGWSAEATLRSYLQVAEAAQVLLRLDPPQSLWLEHFVKSFAFLEVPPAATYSQLCRPWIPTRRSEF
jgi:hypothetical protein